MKQLIDLIEAFLLAAFLIEGCQFRRGLQIRMRYTNPAATEKSPV